MKVYVVIPALNEAQSLPGVLQALPPVDRCVVVDNGSTDGTARVARECGVEAIRASPRGYGTAVQAGMAHFRPDPPDVLVILDADHADPPETLPKLVQPIIDDEADLVQSDRTQTAERGAMTFVQRFGNRLATELIALQTGFRFSDMGPFRAIRWTSLESLQMEDPTWGWNVEMQLKAIKHGLRIREIPLPYHKRVLGESKISGNLRGAAKAGVRILYALAKYR
ncbi:MAG: glycosyltransferase family 2 protein [Myxococcota bacterium]